MALYIKPFETEEKNKIKNKILGTYSINCDSFYSVKLILQWLALKVWEISHHNIEIVLSLELKGSNSKDFYL